MIILRDCLVRPGIIDSKAVCAQSLACQLFFRNLLHACDGAGRFLADADELRHAFYRRAPGVSRPHVEAWLAQCHQARLVKLYTRDGLGYGEILKYGQRDKQRRVLYPPPDDGELNFAAAPPGPPEERNRIEGKGTRYARRAQRATPAPAAGFLSETQSQWIARLEGEHPGIDIVAELHAAAKNRRLQHKKLERDWFEKHWLANLSVEVTLEPAGRTGKACEPEPEGWRGWLEDAYPHSAYTKGGREEGLEWGELPADVRAKFAREINQGGVAH